MLNTKLAIHDLHDVEAFCNAALDQHLKRWQARLEQADRDDALAYLISETWRISNRYDEAKSPSFTAYARAFQVRFLIQFYRDRFVDTRNEHRYTNDEWAQIKQFVFDAASLDAPVDGHTDNGNPGTLGDLVSIPESSTQTDSDTALARSYRERHRFRTSDVATLRSRLLTRTAA